MNGFLKKDIKKLNLIFNVVLMFLYFLSLFEFLTSNLPY